MKFGMLFIQEFANPAEVLFVATFFASRVVWMPLVVSRVLNKPELKARGAWRFALVGMMMHNFHRFRQIIQMTARLAKQ